ncbi:putative secreted protein (Por secretion system target) [Chitinophaga niastensis]|uniref:Putative secreted protein (Por secretion system target) n=1 Tax=Chitinophaga niastensis TaxID=536980 RepID=A0A2P8HVQ2_CHINA|nr:pre-peptidase C-terminal domain-containing protein [Chitinophaga niastensis]PSL50300.1 putative secreted protein (Por secretion system target) [Chitinophaga niastensis]
MQKALFILLGALLISPFLKAQVSKGGRPHSYTTGLTANVSVKTIAAVPVQKLRLEDEQNLKQGLPLRIGMIAHVNYSPGNSGTWTNLPGGDRVWRLKIQVQGAVATSLYYEDFLLPEGATLHIYNGDRTQLIGGYTSANNQETGQFATEILKGNVCVVEYFEPKAVRGKGHFTISGVNNIYSNKIPESKTGSIDKTDKSVGASGSCNVNVNCPEGANWQNQKRAVARILLKLGASSYLCTGALINNARKDCKPYFLTANHCGSNASVADFNQWIFYFNYEAPSCANPAGEPASNTITGCVQRARAGDGGSVEGSDFQLLEFTQAIPTSYNVYYSGWNAAVAASPSGVGIHHPAGDIKKISTYSAPLVEANYNGGGTAPYTHWQATWVQTQTNWGITEGGSSGSPLFNNVGQIVGQLSGGPSSCTAATTDKYDYYGKVARSWVSNGTDALHQLKPWLDPDNTGVVQLNGTNYPCGDTTHPTVCPDPYEPNNTLPTATSIVTGTDIRATISSSTDTDYFRIQLTDTSRINIVLDNLIADFNLRLLSAGGTQLAISQNTGTTAESIVYNGPAGTYYIQVYGSNGAHGDSICYRLNATATVLGGCTDQLEPNNTLATAAAIATGTDIRAQISSATDVDYYKFTTTGTNDITIHLDSLPGDYDVKLLSAAGAQLGISQNGGTTPELITYGGAVAGTYYVEVYGYNGAFSNTKCYRLNASLTPVTACTDAYEPNETLATAAAISANTTISAQISSATDKDWYKFNNTSTQPHIEILLTNLPADYDVILYNASGTELGRSENGGTTDERIVYNNGAVGTYYIQVYGYNGNFSNTKCYKLTDNISSTPKQAPVAGKNSKFNEKSLLSLNSGMHVYPVPAGDVVYIELNSATNKQQHVTITDIGGKILYNQPYRVVSGYNRLEVLLPASLKSGVYIISMDRLRPQKFVLQR